MTNVDTTSRSRTEQLQRQQAAAAQAMKTSKDAQSPSTAGTPDAAAEKNVSATRSPASADVVQATRTAALHAEQATKYARETPAGTPVELQAKVGEPRRGLAPKAGEGEPYVSARERALQEELAPFAGKTIPSADDVMKRLEKTKGYKELSPEDREQTRASLSRQGDVGRLARAKTDELLKQKDFQQLPAPGQLQQLESAVFPELPPDPTETLSRLKESPAWKQLDTAGQKALETGLRPGPMGDEIAGRLGRALQKHDDSDPKAGAQLLQHAAALAEAAQRPGLDEHARETLKNSITAESPPFAFSSALRSMTQSSSFQKLSATEQQEALRKSAQAFMPGPPDGRMPTTLPPPSAASTKAALDQDPAYKALDPTSKEQLDRLVGGQNGISEHARARLDAVRKSPAYQHASAAEKQNLLKNFDSVGGLPYGADTVTPSPQPDGKATVTASKDVPAKAGVHPDATSHTVTVERDGKKFNVDVVIPKKFADGMHPPTLDQIKNALSRLPDDQLQKLKQVVVDPNNDNGSGMYTMGDDGKAHIVPAGDPQEAKERFEPGGMAEILTHEVGHLASITPWGSPDDPANRKWDAYKSAMQKDGIAPSMYARTKVGEDFAEAYALYTGSMKDPKRHAEYRKLFPQRFAVLDKLVKGG